MRAAAIGLTIVLGIFALTARPATQPGGVSGFIERIGGRDVAGAEVLVKTRGLALAAELAEVRSLTDADSVTPVGNAGVRRVRSKTLSAAALLQRLAKHPDIEYAEPNYIVRSLTAR